VKVLQKYLERQQNASKVRDKHIADTHRERERDDAREMTIKGDDNCSWEVGMLGALARALDVSALRERWNGSRVEGRRCVLFLSVRRQDAFAP